MKDKCMREQSLVLVLHERRVKGGNVMVGAWFVVAKKFFTIFFHMHLNEHLTLGKLMAILIY